MTSFIKNKKVRIVFLILGVILLINGVLATVLASLTLGVILTYAVGLLLILLGLHIDVLSSRPGIIVKTMLLAIIVLLFLYSTFVYIYGGNDNVTYEEDAVIVLGTTVNGDQPSSDLKSRLDAALEYHKQNSDAIIIVTGGQGTEENDTEASVMAKYLVDAGLPSDIIKKESRATSTAENFEYSAEILENLRLSESADESSHDTPKNASNVAYITNDFHIFRAGILAKDDGFDDLTHIHGDTPWYMVVPNGFRETVVTAKMWLID